MESFLAQVAVAIASGYAAGSIPFAYLAGRLKGQDIRRLGDGNVGAENAYHELGPRAGLWVGVADIAKGGLIVALLRSLGFAEGAVLSSGVAAVAGHIWPALLQFKGGRGAAATAGVLAVVLFPASVVAGALALLVLTRRGTVAGCSMLFMTLPLFAWALGLPAQLVFYAMALPMLAGLVHFHQVMLPHYQRTGHLSFRAHQ